MMIHDEPFESGRIPGERKALELIGRDFEMRAMMPEPCGPESRVRHQRRREHLLALFCGNFFSLERFGRQAEHPHGLQGIIGVNLRRSEQIGEKPVKVGGIGFLSELESRRARERQLAAVFVQKLPLSGEKDIDFLKKLQEFLLDRG